MPALPLTPQLSKELTAALRRPLSPAKIAFQIVAIQLRVWLADETNQACRPWYIFCLELYPRGKVINQEIHRPASQKPSPSAILSFLARHITDPPSGESSQRPTHVSFVDSELTSLLSPHISHLKIETGTLSLADGVADYVKAFSDKLVKMDRATRGDAAERQGILSVKDVTPPVVERLMNSAKDMYATKPWTRFPENIALEFRFPSEPNETYRPRYYATVLGSGDKAYGFAIMPSLKTLREKYKRAMLSQTTFDEDMAPPMDIMQDDTLVCAACGKRVGESSDETGGRYVDRCGGCKRLLYCSERCQKLDWRERHKDECELASEDEEFVFKRDEWAWLKRELALLYLDPTAVPFDDLDAFEEHGWKFIEESSPPLYPMLFVNVVGPSLLGGKMDRPTNGEVEYATLVASALTECVTPPPKDGIVHLKSGVSISFAENLAETMRVPL